jgi:hypothetical protein
VINLGRDKEMLVDLQDPIRVCLKNAGITEGTVPCFIAEDESAFTRSVMVDCDGSRVFLVGFCGSDVKEGHKCTSKPVEVTEFGEESYEKLKEILNTHRQGSCE